LRQLVQADEKSVYRVERTGQSPWLLRAAAPQASPDAFRRDAAILTFLESHAYPAPRIVPALDGVTVTECMERPVFITTYITGESTDYSPASLGLLGESLGRLHALPLPTLTSATETQVLPPANMLPRSELVAAHAWLAEVRERVPRVYRARFEQLETACHALDLLEDLPLTLIHNDCHPANSVRTPDAQVVLIDWEGAGCGAAIIDVGFLLVSCEIEAFRPNRLLPDPRRMAAVVDGYCRHHQLSRDELDRLPDAIRFRSIVACAGELWSMVRKGRRNNGSDWAWARFLAADEIAARARERFERHA